MRARGAFLYAMDRFDDAGDRSNLSGFDGDALRYHHWKATSAVADLELDYALLDGLQIAVALPFVRNHAGGDIAAPSAPSSFFEQNSTGTGIGDLTASVIATHAQPGLGIPGFSP